MSSDKNDQTQIDFNSYWEYCSRPTSNQSDDKLLSQDSDVGSQWFSVTLPHIPASDQRYNYWYRKHFDWIIPDERHEQQVYLFFDSCDDEEQQSNAPNITGSIWLNDKEILSSSSLQGKSIELTNHLVQSSEDGNTSSNILLVHSIGTRLTLNARLIVFGTMIWTSAQLKTESRSEQDADESNSDEENNNVDYTVRVDGADRRISVVFSTPNEDYQSSLPTFNRFHVVEEEEHLENISIVPRLTIVILIVGTRGDVQPFIALGKELLAVGHRVRLATHEVFRSFVRENGLEFYPLAGNPADLMSFMVKNAGIIPSMSSIVAGDVGKHRHILADILKSTWLACTANDDETSLPFTAEAIIANPPSFGHIHCAEKLQIPLHMMFTMPWSPTTSFPHPFCNIDSSRGPTGKINFHSYHAVEMLTWSGMRGIINHFRRKILGLSSLHAQEATSLLVAESVPHTYCWSPALVSKPPDWQSHINISGFFFLDLCTTYTNPPQDLLDFLGIDKDRPQDEPKLPAPIYIGFGSITGHDSRRLLDVVLDALERTGHRAVLSGLATDADQMPKNVFKIGSVPHDWLFQYVWAVCHHGGAGTTAAGLRAGKPTIVVPFFGDQFFWGNVIEKSGAGPSPLPGRSITATALAEALVFASQPAVRQSVEHIRDCILKENGCQAAVRSFHANLPHALLRSDLESTFAACYRINGLNIQISRPVAHVLLSANIIDASQLHSHHTCRWRAKSERKSHKLSDDFSGDIKRSHSRTTADNDIHLALVSNSSARTLGSDSYNNTESSSFQSSLSFPTVSDTSDSVYSLSNNESETNEDQESDDNKLKTSFSSAVLSLCHKRKSNLLKFLKRSRFGHQESEELRVTADALIATTKCAIQPAVCSISKSPNWFSTNSPQHTCVSALIQTIETQSCPKDKDSELPSAIIQAAVAISGFEPKTCEQILQEFDQMKTRQHQVLSPSPIFKRQSKHKFHFRRQRSHSTSELEQTEECF
ncbi:unnamed protein product [Adineta ricciae]|uniref:Sterol 3-beta-glucosyltransferase n=1 Tax=Adineta ricciae TaxID=249248 RepID=A0A816CIT2_ADIRI|nr:unnamed protein product [Adineta ricciae]CAF1621845.1 unnamed protein product [Adineta ricciae]